MGEEFKVQDEVEQAYRQGYFAGCNNDNRVSREDFTKACGTVYSSISSEYNVSVARLKEFVDIAYRLDKELFGDEEHK